MICAWRIVHPQRLLTALTGEPASRHPGRWNHFGIPMIYTASSQALAALEILVHADMESLKIDYVAINIKFDGSLLQQLTFESLPQGWDSTPAVAATKDLGTRWANSLESAVLSVPSAVIKREVNYLINPLHPDFAKIKRSNPEVFVFDPRLYSSLR
jgi:RES domain-containing protein